VNPGGIGNALAAASFVDIWTSNAKLCLGHESLTIIIHSKRPYINFDMVFGESRRRVSAAIWTLTEAIPTHACVATVSAMK
jgi:hypothetical protein